MHTNYQPRKPGLIDMKILDEKGQARTGKDAFGYYWGRRKGFSKAFLSALEARQTVGGIIHVDLRYSDRGDFTRCYRGGF